MPGCKANYGTTRVIRPIHVIAPPPASQPASVPGTSVIKVNAVSSVNQQIRDDEVTAAPINIALQPGAVLVKIAFVGSDAETCVDLARG